MSIEVSMKCPCGAHLIVDLASPYSPECAYACHCPDCYDGAPDSGGRCKLVGHGSTHEEAIAACWATIEEAWEIDYMLTERAVELTDVVEVWAQASAEAERTKGWTLEIGPLGDYGGSCEYYTPPPAMSAMPVIDLFEALKKSLEGARQ